MEIKHLREKNGRKRKGMDRNGEEKEERKERKGNKALERKEWKE